MPALYEGVGVIRQLGVDIAPQRPLSEVGPVVLASDHETTIAALQKRITDLTGDDEALPRYTTRRLRQEVERARDQDATTIADLRRHVEELEKLDAWRLRTHTEMVDALWGVLVPEPHREGGRNLIGRVCELLLRATSAETALADRDKRVKALEDGLRLALEYWAHRQQRYKNRHPVWVQTARALLAGESQ